MSFLIYGSKTWPVKVEHVIKVGQNYLCVLTIFH